MLEESYLPQREWGLKDKGSVNCNASPTPNWDNAALLGEYIILSHCFRLRQPQAMKVSGALNLAELI